MDIIDNKPIAIAHQHDGEKYVRVTAYFKIKRLEILFKTLTFSIIDNVIFGDNDY